MSAQIFELASVDGIQVMGISDTEDHRVRVAYIVAPIPHNFGDTEETGQMTGRQMMALGHVLVELGAAILGGDLKARCEQGRPPR